MAIINISVFSLVLFSILGESSEGGYPIPYALSPVYLEYLESLETELYHLVKGKDFGDLRKEILEKYILEYEDSIRENVTDNASTLKLYSGKAKISHNPILSLQMINRFVKYFKDEAFTSTVQELMNVKKKVIPTPTEIDDSMEALLRLQHVYDLDSNQIAEGILDGVATNARLSSLECFEFGKFAHESGYYTLALQWYETASIKLKYDGNSRLQPRMILKAMNDTIKEHNDELEENLEGGDTYSFSKPIHTTNYSEIAHLRLRKRFEEELTGKFLTDKHPKYYDAIEANMMALCHGQNLQSEKDKAKLKCWLDTKRHPYWAINPLKIELLHETPPIIQLYDIFSDKWISYLKDLSYSELERAPVPNASWNWKDLSYSEVTARTAAYAWFEDTQIPEAPISKTIEFITDLHVMGNEAAESLQIAAYTYGGHVEPHCDRAPEDSTESSRGYRVNTFLVYLNDVERGGFTAFPMLGFYIKPVKKSAVLWYTNLRNGDIDERTLHAACPVITGQKWIATKWTHIKSNVLKRPCGLKPDE